MNIFLFSPLLGEMIQIDYFSDGLVQPPTSNALFVPRKLFIESYQPRPFSYAVRRTQNHCAEGILSIEDSNQGALVCSMCSKKSNQNMKLLDLCINVRSQRKKQYIYIYNIYIAPKNYGLGFTLIWCEIYW